MNGIDLSHANTAPIKPSNSWLNMEAGEQSDAINQFLKSSQYDNVKFVKFESPSNLVVTIEKSLNAAQRGEFLRKLETEIKQNFDESISLWLPPESDKNSIRKFRGVSIDVN